MFFLRVMLIVLLTCNLVHANELVLIDAPKEAVTEFSSIRLLGKGIKNKTSGDFLGLACYSESCEQVRYVYMPYLKAPQFIGPIISLPEASESQFNRRAVKKKTRRFFEVHGSSRLVFKMNQARQVTSFSAVVLAAAYAWFFPITVLSTAPVLMGSTVLAAHAFSSPVLNPFQVSKMDLRITDQDQWNWSTNPKRVSAKTFNLFYDSVNRLTQTVYDLSPI